MDKEKEEKYIITLFIDGEEKTIERTETYEELKERIKCYRRNNIKIKYVVKEVVVVHRVSVPY